MVLRRSPRCQCRHSPPASVLPCRGRWRRRRRVPLPRRDASVKTTRMVLEAASAARKEPAAGTPRTRASRPARKPPDCPIQWLVDRAAGGRPVERERVDPGYGDIIAAAAVQEAAWVGTSAPGGP